MKDIKLVALDLDGTLFDNSSRISERNLAAIRSITDKGIHVVISTGRPFEGIPFDQIKGTGTQRFIYRLPIMIESLTPMENFRQRKFCLMK